MKPPATECNELPPPHDAPQADPEGQITWAQHTTLVPGWLEPGESLILSGPLYALHDALVKPMPGKDMAPSLAESWTTSADGLVYEFVLRAGVTFHDGEQVTAEANVVSGGTGMARQSG
jgi:peptide/nickel transport system substrate-binding protein